MFVAFLTAISLPQLRSSLATLSDLNDKDIENIVRQQIRELFAGDNSGSPSFPTRGITDGVFDIIFHDINYTGDII
jgi:hypothetical protein